MFCGISRNFASRWMTACTCRACRAFAWALLERTRDLPEEKRRKFYGSLPVARSAFMSMTRIQAVARLCAVYCAEHERELSGEDFLPAFPAAGLIPGCNQQGCNPASPRQEVAAKCEAFRRQGATTIAP